MIEARISNALLLRKLVDAIKDVVQEVNFDCSESGLSIQAMDASHVALTTMLLRVSGFEHYRCDRPHSFGISLVSLAKILKSVGNNPLLIEKEESKDTLKLSSKSTETGKVAEYEMKAMDIDSEHLTIPETEYEAVVNMSSMEFQTICRDLTTLADSVTITISKDDVTFKSAGNLSSGEIKLIQRNTDDGKSPLVDITATRDVSLCLSLPYLNNFSKASTISDVVSISVSMEQPILLEYKIESVGHLRYYLAPKIGQ